MKLIKLTKEYREQLCGMIAEWREELDRTGAKPIPAPIFKNDPCDIERYTDQLEYKTATGDMVPDSVFFLFDEERDRLIGAVHIRHYLNEYLSKQSGHIGIGIRPSERRKGYATLMLGLALRECERLGIDKALITCDRENVGSAKAIIRNGGVLDEEFIGASGKVRQRYTVKIK